MAKEQKVGVLEWRGLLAEEGRLWRMAVVVCILILCASLTFTQLGFAELALPNMDSVYVVLLLVPLAFAALLLGAWYGLLPRVPCCMPMRGLCPTMCTKWPSSTSTRR